MSLQIFGRLAGAVVMTIALAGCVDVTMDVKVKNATEAQGTMTQTIAAQFYSMVKATKSGDSSSSSNFCDKGGKLTENSDGSATCVYVKEGKFADLKFDDQNGDMSFTSPGPGLVKVSFPTAALSKGISKAASASSPGGDPSGKASDAQADAATAQMKQMMAAYFDGHFLTLRVSGGEITDSNMTIAGDKQSAEDKIPFTDLLNGTAKLPAELYAVVKVN